MVGVVCVVLSMVGAGLPYDWCDVNSVCFMLCSKYGVSVSALECLLCLKLWFLVLFSL